MQLSSNERERLVRRLDFGLSPSSNTVSEAETWSTIDLTDNTPTPLTMNQLENNAARSLKDYLHPTRTATPSCIMFPANTPQIDFKPGMIQLLPTFHGLENENPYLHIREFEEVVATFTSQTNALDFTRLKFFPFSLKDKAKSWLYSLRPRSIGSWEEMTQAFFNKYFPNHKTNGLKRQISTFSQKDSETLYQAWERFKDLLNSCPHHGYENWRLVSYFYDGLTSRERQFVEMMCNGDFLSKDPDDAIEYLNELAEKAHTWTGPSATDSTNRTKPSGVYQLREEDNLKAQLNLVTRKLEALEAKDSRPTRTVAKVESQAACFVCGEVDHVAQDCPTYGEMRGVYEEQCNALGMFQKPYSPYSNTYNPGWRNHPNFSWKSDPNNHTSSNTNNWKPEAPPQASYPSPQYNAQPSRPSLEGTLQSFMEAQNKTNQKFEAILTQVVEDQKEMKSQITKLTSALTIQERGKFPSQPQSNPKGQHMAETSSIDLQNIKGVNAITTRSGKILEGPDLPKRPNNTTTTSSTTENALPQVTEKKPPVQVPFPQALKRGKLPENQSEILEHLKEVKVNLPLLHVIKQVPSYAKVIKDLCTIKKRHHVKKTAFLTEQVSAVIEQRVPPKYKDPGCPTITCQIGTHEFGQALLDLGASVNLMPYSVYLLLGLGEIKPTSIVLQLADRSVRRPRGIVEDVLIQIDKFYYPVDFLVLDTQSVVDMESKIPLILGRPFLATANALINCRNGLMKLSFGNMTLEVNIFHVSKQPPDEDECYHADMIDTLVTEEFHKSPEFDPLNYILRDVDNESLFYPDNVSHVSTNFKIQDRRTKFQQQQLGDFPPESSPT